MKLTEDPRHPERQSKDKDKKVDKGLQDGDLALGGSSEGEEFSTQ